MMKRREFGEKLVNSAIGTCIVGSWASKTASGQALRIAKKNALMHVGGDYHSVAGSGITSKENLEFNLRHGVRHLTVLARKRPEGDAWDLDELKRMKDDCDQSGVTLEGIRMDADYITLRKGAMMTPPFFVVYRVKEQMEHTTRIPTIALLTRYEKVPPPATLPA